MSGGRSVAALEEVSIAYGGRSAVEAISLTVAAGSVYALLGRNGAGKSSIVRCLLGMQRPASGRALLFGEDAWRTRARAMARVGVVPETPDVPPAMTLAQVLAFSARLYERWDGEGVAVRLAGIDRRRPFGRLSKGEKAQVSLALALAHAPALLVLDDPTLGLDPVARHEVFDVLISELADRGTTVLLTTHDLGGIEGIADRVGIIHRGRLVVDEPLEDLKARFRRVRGRALAVHGGAPRPAAFGEAVIVADWDEREAADVEAEGLTLEEIFIAVAGAPAGGPAFDQAGGAR